MIYKCRLKTITIKIKEKPPVYKAGSPRAAFEVARKIYRNLDDDQEHLTVLFLNSKNLITGFKTVASGGQDFSNFDYRVIFRNALLFGAAAIILIHNHPSGDTEPSKEDMEVTRNLKMAGEILNIPVLDHLIISRERFYSMAEENML